MDLLPTSSEYMVETCGNKQQKLKERMIGINVCVKTKGKQQACKRLFFKGVAYSSTIQMEEADIPKHWSICCHNTGHCNINSYHTDNLKSHTYLLQSEVSATVAKHKAQNNAHNVHCRSVRW